MYNHCIFCSAGLGENELMASFPTGRRLAFDEALGRLWVICPSCQRWNLSPVEERWEAIEECAALFAKANLKAGTENIQICKLLDGSELVRIGDAKQTEFAAWRYGDQLGARRRMIVKATAINAAVIGGVAATLALSGLVPGFVLLSFASSGLMLNHTLKAARVLRISTSDGWIKVVARDIRHAKLSAGGEEGWSLMVPAPSRLRGRDPLPSERRWIRLIGHEANHPIGKLTASINSAGASKSSVQDALQVLEKSGDVEETYLAAARMSGAGRPLVTLPQGVRLALEMCAHEVTERRALEGELSDLRQAWREADEIAAIADSLLLERVSRVVTKMRNDQRA